MVNPLKILKEIQVKLQSTLNIETTTVYSKKKISTEPNKPIAIAEVKNINQSKITISIKIYVNKKLGYERCLKESNNAIKILKNIDGFSFVELNVMPLNFDCENQNFYQESRITWQENENETENILEFGSEKINVKNSTSLKIERQTSNLGATLTGLQFIDFQEPIKKIEGCAKLSPKQFNNLLNALNTKQVSTISFKNQKFKATLLKLTMHINNSVDFQFVEVKNEI